MTDRLEPTQVAGGHTFTESAGGQNHHCALAAGGSAFCWGSNTSGQLGDGTMQGANQPVAVAGGLEFSAIALGAAHTCGVTTGFAVFCWGANEWGQLGDGTTVDRLEPAAVVGPAN